MKVLHWAFVLVAIVLPFSIVCKSNINSRFAALKDEVRINNAVDTATKDAIDQIIAVSGFDYDDEFGEVINITPALAQETINTFFHTLAVNYNIPYKISDMTTLDDKSSDSYIKNYFAPYVPAIVVLAYDGFYVYSQENHSGTYEYELSSKIPYTYEAKNGQYSVGYTLGNDIYLYYDGNCYSGKLSYNDLESIKTEYQNNFAGYTPKEVSTLTSDISMILYALQQSTPIELEDNIIPTAGVNNFLQDYERDVDGKYTVGKFHENRRKTIINILSACLREEINEHNRFADMLGSTYDFYLPEITNDDWVNTINDITVMAFVQGIPLGTLKGVYYNNYALGGSQIVKKDYLYGATYASSGAKLYHTKDCELIKNDAYDVIFIDEDDAIQNGYVPCQLCN